MTDPIAAARALIEPLTGYTPGPWSMFECNGTGYVHGPEQRYYEGFYLEDARLIVASPELRDMVATLADALEFERAKIAAAYVVADAWLDGQYGIAPCVNDLTPADAQAALDNLLTEARLEGWRAGRDAAAQWLIEAGIAGDHESDPLASSIRALPEPKEASHDD